MFTCLNHHERIDNDIWECDAHVWYKEHPGGKTAVFQVLQTEHYHSQKLEQCTNYEIGLASWAENGNIVRDEPVADLERPRQEYEGLNALYSARIEVILCLKEVRSGEVDEYFSPLVEILHAQHRQKRGVILLIQSTNFINDWNALPKRLFFCLIIWYG